MAKKKKYPKKPKQSASVTILQNYLAKCKEVDKFNASIITEEKKRKTLLAQVRKR